MPVRSTAMTAEPAFSPTVIWVERNWIVPALEAVLRQNRTRIIKQSIRGSIVWWFLVRIEVEGAVVMILWLFRVVSGNNRDHKKFFSLAKDCSAYFPGSHRRVVVLIPS